MNTGIDSIKSNIIFTNITKDNIISYKKLSKIFVNYKIKSLRNQGEFPGSRKIFYNLFDSIISNASGYNSNQFIIMQSGRGIIGFASISTSSNDFIDISYPYGEVKDFYISPKLRQKGYGRILNEHIEKIFINNGTNTVLLSPDPVSGIDFWKAMGYFNTGIHQGWGRHFVYYKHITRNENSIKIDNSISELVTQTDLIVINPYNKPQITETIGIWKDYCIESKRVFRKSDVKRMAFIARNNKFVSFKSLYFEGKIVGFCYLGDEIIRYILPEYRNRGFEKELENESLESKKL